MLHPLTHNGNYIIITLLLDQAAFHAHYFMRSSSIAANFQDAILKCNRELHFITIMPRIIFTDDRHNFDFLQMSDPQKGVTHLLLFSLQLPSII